MSQTRVDYAIHQTASCQFFSNHIGIQIHCRIEVGINDTSAVSMKCYSLLFDPEELQNFGWLEPHLFLTEMSSKGETWQLTAEWVTLQILDLKLVFIILGCCPALGVSRILGFSNSSFNFLPCFLVCSEEFDSKVTTNEVSFYLQNGKISLVLGRTYYWIIKVQIFPKMKSAPSK